MTSTLSGCGSLHIPVHIHDETLYYLKQVDDARWAVQMHFLTTGQNQVSFEKWNAISQGKVCMDLSAFDDFNTEIGKLCSQVTCDYETLKNFSALLAQLHGLKNQTEN